MLQETIDFGRQQKKVGVSPVVMGQILELQCRTGSQVQATLLGHIYSTSIQITEAVPVGLCEAHAVKTIDFAEHAHALENITSVYPTLQIVGVALTGLEPNINLAMLHTMYSNKASGFKAQGILQYPILLSIHSLSLVAYCFNPTFKWCREFMEVTCFEVLNACISLSDIDFNTVCPLFQPINEQKSVLAEGSVKEIIRELVVKLRELKTACDRGGDPLLKIRLREIVEKLNSTYVSATEELSYLLELAALQRSMASKLLLLH